MGDANLKGGTREADNGAMKYRGQRTLMWGPLTLRQKFYMIREPAQTKSNLLSRNHMIHINPTRIQRKHSTNKSLL